MEILMLKHRMTTGRAQTHMLCFSMWMAPIIKRYLLLVTLIAMVMTAFGPGANADVYVTSRDDDRVLRYDEATGAFIGEFVSSGSGMLRTPTSLLLAHDGNLYVSSNSTNSVVRYDGTTGAPLPAPGQPGAVFASGGGLQGPTGLILGHDGNLYVDSQNNDSLMRYDGATGAPLPAAAQSGAVFVPSGGGGLGVPTGLVFGPDGNLYVSSATISVMRYDGATGAPLPAPGQSGAVFASEPFSRGLVFGPDGYLYVADVADNSVVRINGATGEVIDTFVSPGRGGLNNPTGLLFGPDNNLYVCSANTNSVLRYDGTTGAFIDAFIPSGSGGLIYPSRLFFTNTDPTTLAYVPPPRSRFLITAPSTAVSGTPFDVTVTALDPTGNIDTNYQGTVTFATTDTGQGVMLPGDYTFTTGEGADNGVHTFSGAVTIVTVGNQTLSATDKLSSITGNVTITVGPGP
jgi:sugar lactone lactonase YvrE